MIPRVLHRIWLGAAPMPAQFVRYGQSWRDLHPGWNLRLWTDDDLEALIEPEVLARCRNAAERSDVLRYRILAREGGIYVDTDVECLRSIEPLRRSAELLAGYEGKTKVGSAVLGASPGHPAMVRAAEEVGRWAGRAPQIQATGPKFLTRVLADFPDVAILPRDTFYPHRWYESQDDGARPRDCYAIHHVARSWGPPADKPSRQLAAREELDARRQQAERRAERAERSAHKARAKQAKAERRADAALERARQAERAWIPPRARTLVGSVARRVRGRVAPARRRPSDLGVARPPSPAKPHRPPQGDC